MARTKSGYHGLNKQIGPNYTPEIEVREHDRVPSVTRGAKRGPVAHFSIKDAGLNTPQPGTGGSASANPKGRRVT